MKKTTTRILAVFLALIISLGAFPAHVLAAYDAGYPDYDSHTAYADTYGPELPNENVYKHDLSAAIWFAQWRAQDDYTAESWAVLQVALMLAKIVYANADATQTEVDEAAINLREAINALDAIEYEPELDFEDPEAVEPEPEPDATEPELAEKAYLRALITEAKALDEEHFAEECWPKLQEAVKAALAVLSNEYATQGEVDGAIANLLAVIGAMVPGVTRGAALSSAPEGSAFFSVPEGATFGAFRKGNRHFAPFTILPSGICVDRTAAAGGRDVWWVQQTASHFHVEVYIPGQTAKLARRFNSVAAGSETVLNPTALSEWVPGRNLAWRDANVYTNLGDSGTLNLSVGESFELDTFRVWQTVDTVTLNYFIEPEHVFELFGGSANIERIGTPGRERLRITAVEPGVSVIKGTYNPVEYQLASGATGFYDAIDPRNTLAVVVNVSGGADFNTGINVRNDFDTYYFDIAVGYREFTFTPQAGSMVRVHEPLNSTPWGSGWETYTAADDGSFTVKLRDGRNIIEVSNGSSVRHHVVRARGVTVVVENLTRPGEDFAQGHTAQISIIGISEPVEKLAGIYNPQPGAGIRFTDGVNSFTSNTATQYQSLTATLRTQVRLDDASRNVFTGRIIGSGGFGDFPGSHRSIPLDGAVPNFTAPPVPREEFGAAPVIVLPVAGGGMEDRPDPRDDAYYQDGWFVVHNPDGNLQDDIDFILKRYFGQFAPHNYSVVRRLKVTGSINATYDIRPQSAMQRGLLAAHGELSIGNMLSGANEHQQAILRWIEELDFVGITEITGHSAPHFPASALRRLPYLERVRFPVASSSFGGLNTFTFEHSVRLSTVVFGDGAFTEGVIDLRNAHFPGAGNVFRSTGAIEVVFPPGSTVLAGMFQNDLTGANAHFNRLERVTFRGYAPPTNFAGNSFNGNTRLRTFVFESPTAPAAIVASAFTGIVPFAQRVAYVPNPTSGGYDTTPFTTHFPIANIRELQGINTDLLTAAISEAEGLVQGNYRPSAWVALQTALAAASAVLPNPDFQGQIDAAYRHLRAAINALERLADKAALNNLIGVAGALDVFDFTPSSWDEFFAVLSNAIAVSENPEASQQQVDEALGRLNSAMEALEALADKDALIDAIGKAEALNQDSYTWESWGLLQSAWAVAVNTLHNSYATQEDVGSATDALLAAIAALVPAGGEVSDYTTVFISFEGFNLGHGFYIEPVRMTIPYGSTVEYPTQALLTGRGHTFDSDTGDRFFLDNISGFNRGYFNPPDYIDIDLEDDTEEGGPLGALMFSGDSGWMFTLNNIIPQYGAGVFALRDGDVIRWQFSVQQWGRDLGVLWADWDESIFGPAPAPLFTHADKTALIRALFVPNADPVAKQVALDVIINPLATPAQVADALQTLLSGQAPQVNRSALNAAIAQAEGLAQANFTPASWAAMQTALVTARQVRNNSGATQGNVDTAAKNLEAAMSSLVYATPAEPVDKTLLIVAIAQAEGLAQTNFTPASWAAKQTTLTAARQVRDNAGATQAQVNAARNNLLTAIAALEDAAEFMYAMNRALAYIRNVVPNPRVNAVGGEWTVLALARAERLQANDPWLQSWFGDLTQRLAEAEALTAAGNSIQNPPAVATFPANLRSWTDFQRVTLALSSLGINASAFEGHNLTAVFGTYVPRAQRHSLNRGINADIYALIALNAMPYSGNREPFIQALLSAQRNDGSWSMTPQAPTSAFDLDMTAMAVQALAPYYRQGDQRVVAAVGRALNWLTNWSSTFSFPNAESTAQMVVALTALGPAYAAEAEYYVQWLLRWFDPVTGGFRRPLVTSPVDLMATEQAAYALVAYWRFITDGMNALHDMRDAFSQAPIIIDRAALIAEIALAQRLNAADFTVASWAVMQAALTTARNTRDNANATQQQVNAARNNLRSAVDALARSSGVDVTALIGEIRRAEGLIAPEFTTASWLAMQTALAVARQMHSDTASSQSQVNTAASNLRAAIDSLVRVTNFNVLDSEIARAERLVSENFTSASWSLMQTALTAARQVRNNNAATQAAVDTAANNLQVAINGLVSTARARISVIDPNATGTQTRTFFAEREFVLNTDETAYSLLRRTGLSISSRGNPVYVEAINGWGEFDDGPLSGWMFRINGEFPDYSASLRALSNGDRVEWLFTRDLGRDLGGAFDGGRRNRAALDDAIADAAVRVQENYTAASWAAMQTALTAARRARDNQTATQAQIDEAESALRAALNGLSAIGSTPASRAVESSEATVPVGTAAELLALAQSGESHTVGSDIASVTLDAETLAGLVYGVSADTEVQLITELLGSDAALTEQQLAAVGNNHVVRLTLMVGSNAVREFDGMVVVSIPYTPRTSAQYHDLLTVYHLANNGDIREMGGARHNSSTMSFATNHFSMFFISEWISPFADVGRSGWYFRNVRFAYSEGFMRGTAPGQFSPGISLSRAMVVTMLWRLEGEPDVNPASGIRSSEFGDVAAGQWYSEAIAWAHANGIVSGFGDGRFAPGDNVTREQFAVMLRNYAEFKGQTTSADAFRTLFADEYAISAWARDAMRWANANGLIAGRTQTTLVPSGTATRAEAAAILERFISQLCTTY